ncbi:MAG: antitoxin Xre/MbcA/ParS toxin-binding domain-containing protein [Myxococcaceae bacterium]
MGCGLPVLRLRREKLFRAAVKAHQGDEAKARAWLKAEQPALGGVPEHLCHELDEFQRVLAELEAMVSR